MMFKERLRKLRLSRGMTQEQLADELSLPHSTIRRYESMNDGYPKEERLQQIADYFKCTVDHLLGREAREPSIEETELKKEKLHYATLIANIADPVKKQQAIAYLEFLANSPTDGAKK